MAFSLSERIWWYLHLADEAEASGRLKQASLFRRIAVELSSTEV